MGQFIAAFGGGFKPPTFGHFWVVKEALKQFPEIEKFIIFVGSRVRDGITQEQSIKIWDIYKKYLNLQNIEIKPSNSPVRDILSLGENQEDTIYFVIGQREDNENDTYDINKRTTGVEKRYPNIKIKVINTPNLISGTQTRINLKNKDQEEFYKNIPEELSIEEKEEIYNMLVSTINEEISVRKDNEIKYWALFSHLFTKLKPNPDRVYKELKTKLTGEFREALEYFYTTYFKDNKALIEENTTYSNYIDYKNEILEICKYLIQENYNVKPLPKVIFKHNDIENAQKFIENKTGYYDPENKIITLYTEGRHPRDLINSFCHEIVHHIQNIDGRLNNINTDNVLEDDNLKTLEEEAYKLGGIILRSYKDNKKSKLNEIGDPSAKSFNFEKTLDDNTKILESNDIFGLQTFIKEIIKEDNVIEEGIYDSITRKIQKDIFNKWKEDFENKKKISKFEETYTFEDNKGRTLDFDLKAEIKFKQTPERQYIVDGGADPGDEDIEGYIELKFQIDPRNLPHFFNKLYFDIGDVIRHEIEHLTQSGYNERSGKSLNKKDEELEWVMRDLINKYKTLPQSEYYKLNSEIPAMLNGLYYKAKKAKIPFKEIVDDYLELVGVTEEEKKDILGVWRQQIKKLSLPVIEESTPELWTIYCDMDGVLTDFDGRFEQYGNMSPKEYEKGFGTDKFWDLIDKKVGIKFWSNMPWLKDGKILWDYISKHNPIILSAPSQHYNYKKGKKQWVEKNLSNHAEIILTQKENKKNYADKSNILIDDNELNINEWIQAGGIGILHKSARDTISQLKKLGL